MSDRPLSRFLHLERPRPSADGDGRIPPDPGGGRFEGVERPRAGTAARAPTHTGAELDRFGPEPEPPLELVDTEGVRPFTRCMRCGADSNYLATECGGCGKSLDTPEQREWSERFWAARQAESRAEELAREVGNRERRRLDAEGLIGRGVGDDRPLGLRLLGLIPDARWQLAAALGCATLAIGLVVHGLVGVARHHRSPSLAVGILLLVVLALPAGAWRRRW